MSQNQLAERLDVSTQWLSRAENGHENLTIDTLCRMANAVGVKVVELFLSGQRPQDVGVQSAAKLHRRSK